MRMQLRGATVGYERWAGRSGGVPLVLLHAFPLDRRMWDACASQLQPLGEVVAVDFPGLGESEAPADTPSVDGAADDVAAVLDALGLPRAVVCGLSLGGYVALAFAERHRARLLGLALADTRATADTEAQRAARDAAITRVAREGAAGYLAEVVPRLVAPASTTARELALALAGLQRPMGIVGALAALRDRPDRSALLPTLAVPTTVIVGALDAVSPPDEVGRMAAAIPGATFVEIPGAGHLAAMEAPGPFAAALTSLLARRGRS